MKSPAHPRPLTGDIAAMLLTAAIFLPAPLSVAESGAPRDRQHLSWWSAIGTHYRLDPDSWLGTTRDYPRPQSAGFDGDVTALKPAGIKPTVGKFSGEQRYYDFEAKVARPPRGVLPPPAADAKSRQARAMDPDMLDAAKMRAAQGAKGRSPGAAASRPGTAVPGIDTPANLRAAIRAGIDQIWITGQVATANPSRVEFLLAKKGAYYKDLLYALYSYSNSGEFKNKPVEVYWEIGNEVNSSPRFSLRDLGGDNGVFGHPEHAKDYVEYYLAPSVEALRAAAQDVYGDPKKVKILMGSVSGILKRENQAFLDILLNTTIEGKNAPTLAGKKAYEIIDAVVVHYAMGDRLILQGIYDKWIKSGKVHGFWSTEELGNRGRGDYGVALVAMRSLDFMAENGWGNSPRGGVIFWGDERVHPGTPAKGWEAEQLLGPFLRDYPLASARGEVAMNMRADLEWYALRADAPGGERSYVVYARPYTEAAGALAGVVIKTAGAVTDLSKVSVKATTFFTDRANKTFEPKVELIGGQVSLGFDPIWEMGINESAVFLVTIRK